MREVAQLDVSYSTDEDRCSVFVGACASLDRFWQYLEKDYEVLDQDCIGFEMGVDFGINTYDEDFAVMVFHKKPISSIDVLVRDAETFDIDALKRMYPDGLDQPYNAIIILHRMAYDGPVREVQNETFGYFRFLGVFDSW